MNVTKVHTKRRSCLEGSFNDLEAWRGWRDVDGWRLQKIMDVLQDLEARGASSLEYQANYPATIRITDELVDHTRGLLRLFPS